MVNLNPLKKNPRYLSFLSMLAVVLWVMCLVSQDRLISVHLGYICAAVLPYPFLCITFDMIAELYGYRESRRTLWSSLILVYIFVLGIYLFTKLPAPSFWEIRTETFNAAMSPLLRILIFNSIAFITGQYINIYIFSKLRLMLKGRFFGLRSIGSTFIGDTITFAVSLFGDFSGLMTNHSILVLVIAELIIMYLMAIVLAFPASVIVSLLKKTEPDYNTGVTFNPFK